MRSVPPAEGGGVPLLACRSGVQACGSAAARLLLYMCALALSGWDIQVLQRACQGCRRSVTDNLVGPVVRGMQGKTSALPGIQS